MLQVPKLDARYVKLVNDYLNGSSITDLADSYNLPQEEVAEFLSRKEVKSYIGTKLYNSGYLNPMKRIQLLNKIVDDKLQTAEDAELPLSNKDITEVIKLLQQESVNLEKSTQSPEMQINIQSQYTQLVADMLKGDADEE